jgi:hypothetical protein
MRRDKASCLPAGIIAAVLLDGSVIAFAHTGALRSDTGPLSSERPQPKKATQIEPGEGISGSSSGSLSNQLNRSGGVMHPRQCRSRSNSTNAQHRPAHSMLVIPPPGTPGGNLDVKPK